jgi:hypothetical protein
MQYKYKDIIRKIHIRYSTKDEMQYTYEDK